MLGRYIIAIAKDAIMKRTERHPCFIFIDEFQEFADEQKTPQLLRLIREYNAGAVLAHQNMYCDELNESIRNAISTNTSIKYCASPEAQDLSYMARDLRCEPDFLQKMTIVRDHCDGRNPYDTPRDKVQFACFVRGMNPPLKHPFIHRAPIAMIERWQQQHERSYERMKERNRRALQDDPPTVHDVKQPVPPTFVGLSTPSGEIPAPAHEAPEKEASHVKASISAEPDKPIVPPTPPPSQVKAREKIIDPNKPMPWKRS
jgi:hypothetical protein